MLFVIFQISGPPGCGKTQFCIMLSAVSALPKIVGGRGSPVIYIDTEGAFSAERCVCVFCLAHALGHLRDPGTG